MNTNEHTNLGKSKNHYTRFVAMLACSFVAMYITMYLNTYEWDHVWFSLTRFYMVCLGIAAMAIIMFVAMRGMYQNKKKNVDINTYKNKIHKKYIAFLPGSREGEILSLIKYFKVIADNSDIIIETDKASGEKSFNKLSLLLFTKNELNIL